MARLTHQSILPDESSKDDVYAMVDESSVGGVVNSDISPTSIDDIKLATIKKAGKVDFSALIIANQAKGDILYNSGSSFVRLPIGSTGQKLKCGATVDNMEYAVTYIGGWDASGGFYPTDTTYGDYYVISVEGTISGTAYFAGDWIAYNGSSWVKIGNSDGLAQEAYISNDGGNIATGGTIITDGLYTIHKFNLASSGSKFIPASSGNIEVLVVAGGGSGGTRHAGGGGAGGVQYSAALAVVGTQPYTVTVGNGGTPQSVNSYSGSQGGNSVFGSLTAVGGGAGENSNGGRLGDGGCGGGQGPFDAGFGIGSQGYNGGATGGDYSGGGGGGMGSVGQNAPNGAVGGNGGSGINTYSSLLLAAGEGIDIGGTRWISGGGGGSSIGGSQGSGGSGGGGAAALNSDATGGRNGTGSGGGSSGGDSGSSGAGGSGLVIIRYLTQAVTPYSESVIKTQGSSSLKVIASKTISLNKTLTKSVSPTIDLTNINNLKFDIYASRTGSNIKIGLHNSNGTVTEITPNVVTAQTWQTVNGSDVSEVWDISSVATVDKNAIDEIIITIVNADVDNTFYLDNLCSTDLRWVTP